MNEILKISKLDFGSLGSFSDKILGLKFYLFEVNSTSFYCNLIIISYGKRVYLLLPKSKIENLQQNLKSVSTSIANTAIVLK